MAHDATAHRLRWRAGATLVALVAAVLGLTVGDPQPAEADDNGDALLTIYGDLPDSIEFGQDVVFNGSATDISQSCLVIPFDCDEPEGYVYVRENKAGGRFLASADLTPYRAGNHDLSFWGPMTQAGGLLGPGTHLLYIGMESTFRPTGYSWNLTVRKVACSITLTQSRPSSNPGEPVTFTATSAGNGDHSGQMVFRGPGDTLLANPAITGGQASFTTSALPQGTSQVTAQWLSPDPTIYEDCQSAPATHQVATDPGPTAGDDTYAVDAGETITVHPLENDFDIGPGPLRAEYLDSPAQGDAESVDPNGTALRYTAPEGLVTEETMHYLAYDGIGQSSAEATIRFVVGCHPEAGDDAYAVAYGTATTIAGPGVYGNDERCDLPTEVQDGPDHGALSYDGDAGGFTYTPAAGYAGPDSFTYRYADGLEAPVVATVRLSVAPPITPTSTTTTTSSPTTSTTTTTSSPTTSTTTTTPPSPTGSEARVTAWFQALFGRAPDAAGLAYWSDRLDDGAAPAAITRQLALSGEGRRRFVRLAYLQCLDRAADGAGTTFWASQLGQGRPLDHVRIGLLASAEAWQRADADARTWAGLVYEALLGRPASSGDRQWVASSLADGASRARIARAVAVTAEARRRAATTWHTAVLGRPPTASETTDWLVDATFDTPEIVLVARLVATLDPG